MTPRPVAQTPGSEPLTSAGQSSGRAGRSLVAPRMRGIETSPTLALAAKAKALKQAGKPVLDFTAGEPDFPTPDNIKAAAKRGIDANHTRYTPVAGTPELRAAIAKDLSTRLGVPYQPAQILVGCGAKHSLYTAFQVLCEAGDEVIILSPYWVSYLSMVQLAGGRAVIVETREQDGYQPDVRAIERAITPRTKAIVLNSPSNPTGIVIEQARLAEIATLAHAHDLVVITDEIYDQLVYPPHRAWSIVQVSPALADRTLVINGVSKTYSMTGWRIGDAAGPAAIIEPMIALQSLSTSNPASISQDAALEAVAGDQAEVARMRAEFQKRRDRLVQGLNALGLSCVMPHGAFYAWCNISKTGLPAAQRGSRLLDEIFLAVIPGESFGSAAHLRLSFATSLPTIEEGLERLRGWLDKKRT